MKASTPSGYVPGKGAGDAPKEQLKLKYVHGYRAFDTRMNIKYTSDGRVAYHAAALGIVLDKKSNTQTFFEKHDEDIVCFDIHPDVLFLITFHFISLIFVLLDKWPKPVRPSLLIYLYGKLIPKRSSQI